MSQLAYRQDPVETPFCIQEDIAPFDRMRFLRRACEYGPGCMDGAASGKGLANACRHGMPDGPWLLLPDILNRFHGAELGRVPQEPNGFSVNREDVKGTIELDDPDGEGIQ